MTEAFLTADYETPIGLKHYYADGTRDAAFGEMAGAHYSMQKHAMISPWLNNKF